MRKRLSTAAFALLFVMAIAVTTFAQKERMSVSASEVNGTFRMNFAGKFKGSSNEIKILALGQGKLHIAMDLIYPYTLNNGELTANMGSLDGEASITGDTAIYESREYGNCKIIIKFVKRGTIKVTEESGSECGFGHRVTAGGTYLKTSSKKPKFEEQN